MGRATAAATGATTARQRTFAKLVAQGEPQNRAYDKAYVKRGGKPMTRQVDSSKLAAKPNVRALIAEYEAQLVPIGDARECKLRMLANIQCLAYNSTDEKVRLAASIKLHDYMQEREDREAACRTVTVDGLIREIGLLQAPAEAPEMELETVTDEEAASDAQQEAAAALEAQEQAAEAQREAEGEAAGGGGRS